MGKKTNLLQLVLFCCFVLASFRSLSIELFRCKLGQELVERLASSGVRDGHLEVEQGLLKT